MTIPVFQEIMLPLLQLLADKQEHSLREAIDSLADRFKLTAEEQNQLLPSGQQAIFDNRVGWARTYMKKGCFARTARKERHLHKHIEFLTRSHGVRITGR